MNSKIDISHYFFLQSDQYALPNNSQKRNYHKQMFHFLTFVNGICMADRALCPNDDGKINVNPHFFLH